MDLITCEILLDSLNQAKVTYKKGLTGTIILGDKYQQIFTALPEYFTVTDYDIHITASSEVMEDLQTIKAIIPEFVKSQQMDPDIIFEALTSKSLTDLKYKVKKAVQVRKEENNQLQQLQEKLEETSQQAQQLQQNYRKLSKRLKAQMNRDQDQNSRRCSQNIKLTGLKLSLILLIKIDKWILKKKN